MINIRNNTSFPYLVNNFIKSIKKDEKNFLLYHQQIVMEFVMKYINLRGILLFHEMGAGKTILAISLAELIFKHYPNYKKIFLVPKSLHDNIIENMKKINVDERMYTLISSNANNVVEQLKRKFYSLENTIILIDEAHNFFNSLSNGSENAVNIYELLMKAKEIKIILMSGTPIVNDPFEIGLLFNVLNGYTNINNNFSETLFPEYYNTFTSFISNRIDEELTKKKFMSRIVGLVSYYNYKELTTKDLDVPEKLERKIIKIPMSQDQYTLYSVLKKKEEETISRSRIVTELKYTKKNNVTSSYKINTRQICNMLYPEEAMHGVEHDYTKLPKYFYDKIETYSPKISEMYKIINSHKNQKGYIYSQFLDCGLYPFGEFLKTKGYTEFDINNTDIKNKTFSYITGEIDLELKSKILLVYNSPQNVNGDIINLLLMSSVAAQGISLNDIRFLIIMEPYWNQVKIDQIENRGVRINSHKNLKKEDRNIQPYIMISIIPVTKGKEKNNIIEESTDEIIYKEAIKKHDLNNKFLNLIKKSSIDCIVHYKDCFICKPTNTVLFSNKMEHDINRCEEYLEEKIKIKEIIINNEKYYYNNDNKIRIFKWNKILNSYEEIFANDPMFQLIYNKIKSLKK